MEIRDSLKEINHKNSWHSLKSVPLLQIKANHYYYYYYYSYEFLMCLYAFCSHPLSLL